MTREQLNLWTPTWRGVVFVLSSMSIWCLLADFYRLMPMRSFTFCVSIPAMIVLVGLAAVDAVAGDGRLLRGVLIGFGAGFIAAISYDIFRLPFVYSNQWGLSRVVPPMPLYKVFPRFGAMILGEPVEQAHYSMAAQLIGWAYHFSNGITFGSMYTAALGDLRRRSWLWGMVMAAGLELGMLFTPYPGVFGIHVGALFVVVTLVAHLIFGAVLGWLAREWSTWPVRVPATAGS
jgi:hypothetical protein